MGRVAGVGRIARVGRVAGVEARGKCLGEGRGAPGTSLHTLHFCRGKLSSHLDTNRRNKSLLIPSLLHPLAWHQLCAHSLQLAACSRRPGHRQMSLHLGEQIEKGGPGLQQQYQPTAGQPTPGPPQDWHHAHPPSSLCVSRESIGGN